MATETVLEDLVVRMTGDGTNYQSMLRQAEGWTRQAVAQIGLIAGAGAGVGGLLFGSISKYAEMEQLSVAFNSLIGNAATAGQTMRDLKKFAAETPYELPEVAAAAKQALAFGADVRTIVPDMRMLGDVASAVGAPLSSLTYLFGTLRAQGRAYTVDINQFANRGIPIWEELAKVMGVQVTEVRTLVEHGKVGFPQVEQAFKNMTAAGGRFHDVMKAQSQTLNGLVSTLKDNVGQAMAEVGEIISKEVNLKGFVEDIGAAAAATLGWVQNLSPEFKRVAAAIAVATAATLLLVGAGWALYTVVTLATGGLNVLTGLIALGAGALAGTIVALGGVAAAWETVKTKASEFWEFTKPIRQALSSLSDEVGKNLVPAFDYARAGAAELQKMLGVGSIKVDWGEIRSVIVDSILAAEFAVANFGRVWDYLAATVAYTAVEFGNTVAHVLTEVLPAAGQYFADNYRAILYDVFTWQTRAAEVAARNLVHAWNGEFDKMESLPDLFRKDLPAFTAPARVPTEVENLLKSQYEELGSKLAESFAEFRKRKLEEFGYEDFEVDPDATDEAAKKAEQMMPEAKLKVVPKFDAAAAGSVEAAQRIRDFMDANQIVVSGYRPKPRPGDRRMAPSSQDDWTQASYADRDALNRVADGLEKLSSNAAGTVTFKAAGLDEFGGGDF